MEKVTIERKITLSQMQEAIRNSKEVSSKKNKPALRVASILFICQKHLKEMEELQKTLSAVFTDDEEVKEYSEKKNELISKYQEKDAEGIPLNNRQTGEAIIVSKLSEFNVAFKALKEEYSEADQKIRDMEDELKAKFEEKITITITPINAEWIKEMPEKVIGSFAFMFPSTLPAKQLPAAVPSSELIKIMEFCEIEEGEEE